MDGNANNTFVYEITDGLQLHDLVQLQGTITPGGKPIVIELTTQSSIVDGQVLEQSKRTEIPFRCVYSLDGSWELFANGGESRVHLFGHADYTIDAQEPFLFQIVAYKSRFVMYHNEEELFALNYIVPLASISHLTLSGDASFTGIDFMESYDFLKQFHSDMFELIFGSQEAAGNQVANGGLDGHAQSVRATPQSAVKNDSADSAFPLGLEDKSTKGRQAAYAKSDDGLQPNLFDKLMSSGLIHLQQIEGGLCERAPVPIIIGRDFRVNARLADNCQQFYVAVSTVSNKHVAKLLQGEVTLFMSVQLQPLPSYCAYLLHGPVYNELSRQVKLPFKIAPGEYVDVSISFLYKFITAYVNGNKCLNYNYKFFEQADRSSRFPVHQLHYVSVWGDIDKSSVKFKYPDSLIIPYYNALEENLKEHDRPEIRLQCNFHNKTSKVSITLQQGDGEIVQSQFVVRCVIDVTNAVLLFETERYGMSSDAKTEIHDSLRGLSGSQDITLQMDLNKETLHLFSNKILIGSYNQSAGQLGSLTHVTIDGEFVLRTVEYFPKSRKSGNPCCECVLQ